AGPSVRGAVGREDAMTRRAKIGWLAGWIVLGLVAVFLIGMPFGGPGWVLNSARWAFGAITGEHRPARDSYNAGVAALTKGDHEAAEKALLEARSQAGNDPDLLFGAAYDLGVACASHADKLRLGKDADLARAYELANQSVSWFLDANRARPGHADTA